MKIKWSTIGAYVVMASAALIAAWKGSLDWMGLALLAVVFKMPGTKWLRDTLSQRITKRANDAE
jgi:membrane protein implicated in regulation of membrane protease activity